MKKIIKIIESVQTLLIVVVLTTFIGSLVLFNATRLDADDRHELRMLRKYYVASEEMYDSIDRVIPLSSSFFTGKLGDEIIYLENYLEDYYDK